LRFQEIAILEAAAIWLILTCKKGRDKKLTSVVGRAREKRRKDQPGPAFFPKMFRDKKKMTSRGLIIGGRKTRQPRLRLGIFFRKKKIVSDQAPRKEKR